MALLRSIRLAAGAAALAAVAGACDFIHPPTYVPTDQDQLVVHAVLNAGGDSVAVLVTRVGRGDSYPPAVSGARVRVIGDAGAGTLVQLMGTAPPCGLAGDPLAGPPQPTGCYVGVVPGGIRAGAAYQLEVDVPTGERVRGRTVVPAPPVMHAPAERLRVQGEGTDFQTRSVDPLTVRWTAQGPVSVSSTVGRVWAPGVEAPVCHVGLEGQSMRPAHVTADSLRAMLYLHGCNAGQTRVQPDSVEVLVGVTAYDSAYVAYNRERDPGNGIPLDEASAGLEGAFGLFGSAAKSQRRIIFITK
jgi:hypothetical protein